MNTKTPRTDAVAKPSVFSIDHLRYVESDFARQLETELNEAHAVLDSADCSIIRNAKDGYPEGREPRELTLEERVRSLLRMMTDYRKWCKNAEKERDELKALAKELAVALTGDTDIRRDLSLIAKARAAGLIE